MVKVENTGDQYLTHISSNGLEFIADEPESLGGKNLGPDPETLFLSSLGTCTAITLRMYANRKEWSIDKIQVELKGVSSTENGKNYYTIQRDITFLGTDIAEADKEKMLVIANKCPVHKIMQSEISVNTKVV